MQDELAAKQEQLAAAKAAAEAAHAELTAAQATAQRELQAVKEELAAAKAASQEAAQGAMADMQAELESLRGGVASAEAQLQVTMGGVEGLEWCGFTRRRAGLAFRVCVQHARPWLNMHAATAAQTEWLPQAHSLAAAYLDLTSWECPCPVQATAGNHR